jgi:hypothetical protein
MGWPRLGLIAALVGILVEDFRQRRTDRAEEQEEGADVLANIETLRKPELDDLRRVLLDAPRRFDVQHGSIGDGLLNKEKFTNSEAWPAVAE